MTDVMSCCHDGLVYGVAPGSKLEQVIMAERAITLSSSATLSDEQLAAHTFVKA